MSTSFFNVAAAAAQMRRALHNCARTKPDTIQIVRSSSDGVEAYIEESDCHVKAGDTAVEIEIPGNVQVLRWADYDPQHFCRPPLRTLYEAVRRPGQLFNMYFTEPGTGWPEIRMPGLVFDCIYGAICRGTQAALRS